MPEYRAVDNVIFANFGKRPRHSSSDSTEPAQSGSRPQQRQGNTARKTNDPEGHSTHPSPSTEAQSPLSHQALNSVGEHFLRLIEAGADTGRLRRGRDYERDGKVLYLNFSESLITGLVAGSHTEPFEVEIRLPRMSRRELYDTLNTEPRDRDLSEQWRRGNFSPALLEAFLGYTSDSYRFWCSCPDHAPVCKHVIALARRAAARLTHDPMILGRLRGVPLHTLAQRPRSEPAPTPTQQPPTVDFWDGGPLPELPEPDSIDILHHSDTELLHEAVRTLCYGPAEELRAITEIEDMFDILRGDAD